MMRKDIGGPQRIEITHPELVAELHPERNADLTHYGVPVDPRQLLPNSNKRIWWKCPQGPDHEWLAAISDRAGRGRRCPFCRNQSLHHQFFGFTAEIERYQRRMEHCSEDVVAKSGKCVIGSALKQILALGTLAIESTGADVRCVQVVQRTRVIDSTYTIPNHMEYDASRNPQLEWLLRNRTESLVVCSTCQHEWGALLSPDERRFRLSSLCEP